jgi:hypothetical protein
MTGYFSFVDISKNSSLLLIQHVELVEALDVVHVGKDEDYHALKGGQRPSSRNVTTNRIQVIY